MTEEEQKFFKNTEIYFCIGKIMSDWTNQEEFEKRKNYENYLKKRDFLFELREEYFKKSINE